MPGDGSFHAVRLTTNVAGQSGSIPLPPQSPRTFSAECTSLKNAKKGAGRHTDRNTMIDNGFHGMKHKVHDNERESLHG